MSTHRVDIIEIKEVRPHSNAERLEIIPVGGWQAVSKKGQFLPGDRAVYIQPDYTVPTSRPEFAFLAKEGRDRHRLKAVRLRGVLSYGLLIPVPEELASRGIGDDVMADLGIERYDPPVVMAGAEDLPQDQWPNVYASKFDVESLQNYPNVIQDGEPVIVTEKIHGCLLADARISMADGSRKRLCTVNVGETVLGVDGHGKVIPTTVTNRFLNGVGGKWMRIRGPRLGAGRGNSEFSITCTSNHRFWNPETGKYVAASELKTGDAISLIRSEMALTPLQEQVLLGKLLGDGSMADAVTTASIHFGHREEDRDYLEWTCRALGDLDFGIREAQTSGYGTSMIRSRSTGSAWVKERFGDFFSADGPKRVPEWVSDALTPIAVAFWYMDDGSLGTHEGQEDRASFATCAFTEDDCAILVRGLQRLGIMATIRTHDDYCRICMTADNAERLFLMVAPYIPPCMQRKLPERYRGSPGWLPTADRTYKPTMITQHITDITPTENVYSRYDLETGTHNFFANGILVHNSNARYLFQDGVFYMGSRTRWLRPDANHAWRRAASRIIEGWCQNHEGVVLYGEVYGSVQSLKYGLGQGHVEFRAFAASEKGEWWDIGRLHDDGSLPTVPILFRGPYSDAVRNLAEQDSTVPGAPAGHMREGIVIVPERERRDETIGRVALKYISTRYWESGN